MSDTLMSEPAADVTQPAADAVPVADISPAISTPSEPVTGWPEGLIEVVAGGDAKKRQALKRYKTPNDALAALLNAQEKIRSGELKTAHRPDMTEAELTKWREDNGVPEKADGYVFKDTSLSDADKPIVDQFLAIAHASNMHPAQAEASVKFYLDLANKAKERVEALNVEAKEAGIQALMDEHGPEYRGVLAGAMAVLSAAPPEIRALFDTATFPNGVKIGNDPIVAGWLNKIGQAINPHATVVPGTGVSGAQSMQDEYDGIRKMMGDRTSDYWKGPKAKALQARAELLISKGVKIR